MMGTRRGSAKGEAVTGRLRGRGRRFAPGAFAALLCFACAPSVPAVDCGIDADCGPSAFCSSGQCLQGTRTCPSLEPKFSSINRSLFQISCGTTGANGINCHSRDGAASSSGLDLATDPYTSLVGQPAVTTFLPPIAAALVPPLVLVTPGDGSDQASFLVKKLHLPRDPPLDPTFGASMPADNPGAICDETIRVIQQWIAQGAPRN